MVTVSRYYKNVIIAIQFDVVNAAGITHAAQAAVILRLT